MGRAVAQMWHEAWWDEPYRDLILHALAESKDTEALYIAGKACTDARFGGVIVHALVETKDVRYLYLAGKEWLPENYNEAAAEVLVKSGDAEYLYRAGPKWPDNRFSAKIAQALVATCHVQSTSPARSGRRSAITKPLPKRWPQVETQNASVALVGISRMDDLRASHPSPRLLR